MRNYHNDGEKDASNGEYNPPHDVVDEAVGFFTDIFLPWTDTTERINEENENYDKGVDNTNDQLGK